MGRYLQFTSTDLQRFADWSGDRNPLHVDDNAARRSVFRTRVVHGALTTIGALNAGVARTTGPVERLDVEFRGALHPDASHTLHAAGDAGCIVEVRTADAVALTIRLDGGGEGPLPVGGVALPVGGDTTATLRPDAADLDLDALRPGRECSGAYRTGPVPAEYLSGSVLRPVQIRTLALCSYIIGMEMPGLRSLFTRLRIAFAASAPDVDDLRYRVRVVRVDPHFRLLDLHLDVLSAGGDPVATAELRAYVRFTPARIDPRATGSLLSGESLRGRVALVTGGTRGLGAEITTALAMAGAHVYASYQRDEAAASALARTLRDAGAAIEVLAGDAADPAWCAATLSGILSRHARLDLLVLNACAPPVVFRFGSDDAGSFGRYVAQNLSLVQVPLSAALAALTASGGTIVGISSSFVADPPAGFAPYVALKQAVEATVRAAAQEADGVRAVLPRPPRLQTAWNDTPTGVVGTVSARDAAVRIVQHLNDAARGERVEILSDFAPAPSTAEPESPAPAGPVTTPEFVVSLAATFTADPLLKPLDFWFRELGVRGEVQLAPYGQVLQTLLTPAAPGIGLHVVLLRLRDWLRELSEDDASSPEFVRAYLTSTAGDFERALRAHRGNASAGTLLLVCPSAAGAADPTDAMLAAVEDELLERLTGIPGVTVARAAGFHALYGVAETAIADPVREELAHIPYQPGYLQVLATLVIRHVHRRLFPARKVIVVDCDNTLWGGVVGEVGAGGVRFDEGHQALHALLARLAAGGVLIALCSKNEEADVWRVFDERPELTLGRDAIVTSAINWLPKSANLRAMADRLNLGLDSFVFIDDNPVECAEVRSACPDVLTLQWPQDPVRARAVLDHTWEFDARTTTAEDQRRTELYKEEFRRQELQSQALTFRDFIASLDLSIEIAPLAADDLPRASQLTLRTNQFNFTTRRRDEAELRALPPERFDVRTVRVRDRFGDYGLVGLLIADCDGDKLNVDTFLLSCRVLGRGVEHRMIAELGRMAEARGITHVGVNVVPTARNTPARAFFDSVVPADLRCDDAQALRAVVPAALAAAAKFVPPDQAPAVPVEDPRSAPTPTAAAPSAMRARERLIERTAFDLSTPDGLRAAIEGSTAMKEVRTAPVDTTFVFDAFASALGVDPSHVKAVDSLERLGCDSFKIVEITVTLLERVPALPGTLLFEHKRVSEIAARVAALSRGTEGASPAPTAPAAVPPIERTATGDIAVVGMHVRCAGADSPADLWRLLSAADVAVAPVPTDRAAFFGRLDDARPHFAGLLEGVDRFDAELFGITPREAALMDPQLRLFLEVAWSALEDAGCLGELDPDTGVFAGVMYGDYGHRANLVARHSETPFKSWEGFSLANRLSQVFGFRGPSLAVDTACSSSATAIHLAARALLAGDCRVAIAGGVNLILDPDRFVQLGRLGILSATGRCLPFGADADGTVLGEGAGVVVLRPLADAVRRGDRIYGVIKATGVSTGSGTVGFTAPNPQAQAVAIRRAVAAARIDPRTIGYVETHGTGTALGDPIEVRGLTLAYGSPELHEPGLRATHACAIGSIKPNIGHLEAGAGVLGLIKVLLQLHHRTLLPSVTSDAPNPQIPFKDTPFAVQRRLAAWNRSLVERDGRRTDVPRRAALNSFGIGGANVHVVLEEAPLVDAPPETTDRPLHILTVSARTADALRQRADAFSRALASTRSAADICFSANTAQRPLEHRAAVTGRDAAELQSALASIAAGDEPAHGAVGRVRGDDDRLKVAFLFTGQGSQYAGMGRELYETQPVFRAALDRCFDRFAPLLAPDLKTCMFAAEGTADAEWLNQTGHTQPALFSIGYALSELWRSWGIEPGIVLGHSIGELTAMCVAGGLSLDDAVTVVAARGRLMQALPAGGTMTSIMTTEARVAEAVHDCRDRVSIAAINGPQQVVISGEAAAVTAIAERFAAEGVRTRSLVVSHAFHSPLMQPMLDEYRAVLRNVRFRRPSAAFVSAVEGGIADDALLSEGYWIRNVIDPVRFTDAIRATAEAGAGAYVEMGPQPVLLALAQQSLPEQEDRLALPSIRKDGRAWPALLDGLARLHAAGQAIDWRGFDAPYRRMRLALPAYPFGGRRYWIASAPPSATDQPTRRGAAEQPAARGAGTYEITWREQPSGDTVDANGLWLVLDADGDLAPSIAASLEARGGLCVVASLPSSGAPDLPTITGGRLNDLRGVVVATPAPGTAVDRAALARQRVDTCVELLQAVGSAPGCTARVWFVTRAGVSAGLDPNVEIDPAEASLWGFGRAFGLEQPDRWGGLIDLDPRMPAVESGAAVAAEVLAGGLEDQVALRAHGRYVARLKPLDQDAASAAVISPEGCYLVTGGLGALGLHVARWLVARGARHLVLTGRRGADTPGTADALRDLRATGANVIVVAADVSRPEGIAAAVKAVPVGAPITGVFHAAGIDDVTPVERIEREQVPMVMGPKAGGAWWLHVATRTLPVQMFVCFSSIAAVTGAPGRTIYAAANAFLDGLVHERRRLGLPALSVNWGPWAGGGMASPEALARYERSGNRGLSPAVALSVLDRLLGSGVVQATAADIDWPAFRHGYEARRVRPLAADVETPPPAAPKPAAVRPPWIERLALLDVDARGPHLEGLLTQEIADTLGFDVGAVAADRRFSEMGMDSLMAADFAQRLQTRVGVKSTALVFEHPTVQRLAKQLLEQMTLSAVSAPVGVAATLPAVPVYAAPAAGVAVLAARRPDALAESRPPGIRHDATVPGSGAIERYRAEAEPDVFTFLQTAFPHRAPGLIAPRWRWMFVDSARRLARAPQVWLHRQDGKIVGHNGAIPVRLGIGDAELETAWLVETMVLQAYRSQAVGARLMVEADADLPFALSLGQTAQMRAIQLRLGWQQVAPLQTAQRLIRPERVLKGKLPGPAAMAAGLALRASGALRGAMKPRTTLRVRELTRFDESHDWLWEQASTAFTCAVRRDASYMNWKYVDQPGQTFLRLEAASPSGQRAVVVLMLRDPDEAYRYRRAFLVDLVAPVRDRAFMADLLEVAIGAAAERNADALLCLHIGSALTSALADAGFRMREPSRYLLVRPGLLDGSERQRVLDGSGWFVTQGDSDIDRPW